MKTLANYHVCNHCVIGEKTFTNILIGPGKGRTIRKVMGGMGKKPKKNSCKGKCQEKKFVQRRRKEKKFMQKEGPIVIFI